MERSKAHLSRSNRELDDDNERLRNGDFGESRCTKSSEKPTFLAWAIGNTKEWMKLERIKKQRKAKIPELRAMTIWIIIIFSKGMKKKLWSFCYFYREKKTRNSRRNVESYGNNVKIEYMCECSQGEWIIFGRWKILRKVFIRWIDLFYKERKLAFESDFDIVSKKGIGLDYFEEENNYYCYWIIQS